MSEAKAPDNNGLYVRRGEKVQGPYPRKQIIHFAVLGRIIPTDELSEDGESWKPLSEIPQLNPHGLESGVSPGTVNQILMREDERDIRDRRHGEEPPSPEVLERRKGEERRKVEKEEVLRHRALKSQLLEQLRGRSHHYGVRWAVVVALLLVVFIAGVGLSPPADESGEPDCTAAPAPGVNWDNCRMDGKVAESAALTGATIMNAKLRRAKFVGAVLSGAVLSYSDLADADLSYADLTNASLKGATLRNADLTYGNMTNADLTYADLTGAKLGGAELTGANLSNAIWIDGGGCRAGSVGGCLR